MPCVASGQRTRVPVLSSYAMLAGAQIAVGAAAIFARFALTGAGALAVSAGRLTIAAAVLLVIAAIRRGSIPHRPSIPQDDKKRFALAGIALALHFATWIWSLEYTTVAISTLLVATAPVWTALYDALFARRPLTTLAWLAMAAGGAGTVMVVGFSRTPPPVAGHALLGAALALCGAAAIGAYFVIVRGMRETYGTRAIVTRTYTWAAIALIAGAAAARQPPPPLSATAAWGGIIAMALISQLLGHTAMNAALRWFSASAVAMSTLVEPIAAALLALVIFSEGLSMLAVAGAILILAAIAVFLRQERPQRHGAKQPARFDPARAARLDDPVRFEYLPAADVCALLDAPQGSTVVDFGTGTGTYAVALARARPDLRIVALDEQPKMLELLRAKLARDPVANVQPAGTGALSGLRGRAARVLGINVLHELGDEALRDVRRLLAPGGSALFIDWNADVERPVGPPNDHVYGPRDARARLEANGFRVAQERVFQYHYALVTLPA
jgi:drug/metabolite transporter (DMT)-like permease/SAM-dependent methyltransferase